MKNSLLNNSSVLIKLLFVIALFVLFFIASITFKKIDELNKSSILLTNTHKVTLELEHITSYLKDAETGNRGYLITKDSVYLTPFLNSRENVNNSLIALKKLLKNNPDQQSNLDKLYLLINKRFVNFSKTILLTKRTNVNNVEFYKNFRSGKIIMDEIRTQVNEMNVIAKKLLIVTQQNNAYNIKSTPLYLYLTIIFTLLLIVLAYCKVNHDFDEIKNTNSQLNLYQGLANQAEIVSKSGSWYMEIKNKNFYFSDNLYRLLGIEPQSFEPSLDKFFKFIHPDDLEYVKTEVDKMMKINTLENLRYRLITKDGAVKYIRAYGRIMTDDYGNKKIIGTTSDISDENKYLREVEEKKNELERKNKELSAFNYFASHDLQEPLRKIQIFISRLEDKEIENFTETGQLYIERIKASATRMRLLIDDLLQFSGTNKSHEALKTSNLNELLENVKQDLHEVIDEKKVQISTQTLPETKVIPFQIQQLFFNLLSNSIKYSKENIAPKIDITYKLIVSKNEPILNNNSENKFHKIELSDNGIGFDNEYSKRIFVLFHRLHEKQSYSGTGIGLAICKRIIENHNGCIFASGENNIGAKFTIYLPE